MNRGNLFKYFQKNFLSELQMCTAVLFLLAWLFIRKGNAILMYLDFSVFIKTAYGTFECILA